MILQSRGPWDLGFWALGIRDFGLESSVLEYESMRLGLKMKGLGSRSS